MAQVSPPDVYGIVEPNVYRSNFWHPSNFPFLKSLGLRTLLVLSPDKPLRPIADFCEDNSVNVIHLGLSAWKLDASSWKPVSDELVKEALEITLDVTTHPVMLMCSSGIHQTGTIVGCLRRLQNWNLTSILNEVSCACSD
ncbi:hypothetical protein, variant 1 [Capsaspora owczarzaki ATCC 30864]|uniref:Tyrosine phosphatase n=1 Tax=Capsaspora owczarzaki (strain ATCC 30864) TaxID=595528 RepID=A0A0D2W080_CAPO3|nr:hypothetical protein, variant 1 [Capsaspora owczarzaki ATCC 30864]